MNGSFLIPIELLYPTICVSLSAALSRPALRFGPLLQHSLARVTCLRRTFHPGLGSRSAAGDLHHLHAPLLCGHWRPPSPSCTAAGGCTSHFRFSYAGSVIWLPRKAGRSPGLGLRKASPHLPALHRCSSPTLSPAA